MTLKARLARLERDHPHVEQPVSDVSLSQHELLFIDDESLAELIAITRRGLEADHMSDEDKSRRIAIVARVRAHLAALRVQNSTTR